MDRCENPSVVARHGIMEPPGMCCGDRMRWPGWGGGVKAGAWLAGGVAPLLAIPCTGVRLIFHPPVKIFGFLKPCPSNMSIVSDVGAILVDVQHPYRSRIEEESHINLATLNLSYKNSHGASRF